MDKIFVSGYRTAKNRADFRHTTGNMGMLLSQTQDELDLVQRNTKKNVQVWDQTQKLEQVKKSVFKENDLLVDSMKIS